MLTRHESTDPDGFAQNLRKFGWNLCGLSQRVALSVMMDLDLRERVRAAVDIVDVIGSSLTLVPKGRALAACCPWHDDRSPSLTVDRERQSWKCWVCDIGGDVFSFVMRRDGVDFPSALRMLAEQAGIEYQAGPKVEAGSKDDKSTLLSAVKLVADAYFDQLDSPRSDDAKIARDYLASRGIDDAHRQLFRIGFAPDSWDFVINLLQREKFRPEIAAAAGVALNRNSGNGSYDLFRGRLMFPIHDMQNRPISMGGRVIPAIAERLGDKVGGKYINGPETKLFRKSQQLYGLQLARESIRKGGQALVMEGYTDVIAARQFGIDPVVAVLGTALGDAHVKLLKRLTGRVVLMLDGDAAGQRRADEVLEIFVKADADLRVLTLPDGMDPADYLQAHGRESLEKLVADAPDALEHKLTSLTAGVDVTNDTHAVMQAIDTMMGILAKVPKLDPLKQDQMLLRLSRKFGIAANRLEDRLEQKRGEEKKRIASAARYRSGRDAVAKSSSNDTSPVKTSADHQRSSTGPIDPNLMLSEAAEYDSGEFEFFVPGVHGDYDSQATNSQNPVSVQRGNDREETLSGYDRELFEIMIESTEMAGRAVEKIDPEWLDTLSAKMILAAYQELDLQGRDLDVETLLLFLENDFLKNEVVTMQFRMAQRDGLTKQSAEERFQLILGQFHRRENVAEQHRQIAKIESASLEETEQLELLKQLFDSEKNRHQIDR
ncbi:DNA primase [Stieleria sp. TO1_6]|uniref:DNA primase n=1 Tax=Stieleria tagensis TaxID=2956795 RepID=UPI00209AE70B|nr:DNA primase [Stieleria tagensis]MCO8124432.1 DNA primase [Stieleria tagensis]